MLARLWRRLQLRYRRAPVPYAEAKRLAGDDDAALRLQLARRPETKPEILYYLAADPDAQVRRAIAAHQDTPRQADLVLAKDADEEVRGDLAGKIARVAPGLSRDEHRALYRLTVEILEILARDEATRVRRILAEVLKDVANAPPSVIGRLAQDVELVVAGPVLENSPVLTETDLLELIRGGSGGGALAAISRRRMVGERVSDAIVEAGDVDAIAGLLGNASAQIREETLDRIVDMAPEVEAWHGPLVRRPRISARTAQRLARFVAHSLLKVLEARNDLDPETARLVAGVVERRLAEEPGGGTPSASAADTAEARARRLRDRGELDEDHILRALGSGERAFVTAAVAVLAEVPVTLVEQVLSMQSAKGVVALIWKAGLSMRLAVQLQMRLAGIAPKQVLRPRDGDRYPLTQADMEWQLDFFHGMAPQG